MKILGIDLAGMEKNPTGLCVLEDKNTKILIVRSDSEILMYAEKEKPDLACIDGPTTLPIQLTRKCDSQLAQHGSLPPLVGGMRYLTMRATRLREKLENLGITVLEVNNNATARLLGYWNPDPAKRQEALLKMGFTGDIQERSLAKDEVDAITAALIGLLRKQGKTREVGDEEGNITVPQV